jgi:formamidopyrimidine-DNA glycosylase
VPELPEIHAMVADLAARLDGCTVDRFQALSFSAMKTFDPPATALSGGVVRGVSRHGKYLDLEVGDLHLVIHLALLGWIRWREDPPPPPSRLGKGPVAARLVLDDRSGLDITEFGTKKSLAIWIVRDPAEVPGIARLGPDPLDPAFTLETFARILAGAGRAQIKGVLRSQSLIAGIEAGLNGDIRAV